MKLYMKEKLFSFHDRFTIQDEHGFDKYFVEGEFLSLGKRLHILDIHSQEVALIRQQLLTFMPRYALSVRGRELGEIRKEFTFFYQRYVIDTLGWEVEGSFWEHEFEIRRGGQVIARIYKEWLTWGDCYCLDIADPADELPALAVVLAIDCVAEARSNNS